MSTKRLLDPFESPEPSSGDCHSNSNPNPNPNQYHDIHNHMVVQPEVALPNSDQTPLESLEALLNEGDTICESDGEVAKPSSRLFFKLKPVLRELLAGSVEDVTVQTLLGVISDNPPPLGEIDLGKKGPQAHDVVRKIGDVLEQIQAKVKLLRT